VAGGAPALCAPAGAVCTPSPRRAAHLTAACICCAATCVCVSTLAHARGARVYVRRVCMRGVGGWVCVHARVQCVFGLTCGNVRFAGAAVGLRWRSRSAPQALLLPHMYLCRAQETFKKKRGPLPAGRDPQENTGDTTFLMDHFIRMACGCVAAPESIALRNWAMLVWQCATRGRGEDVRERRVNELLAPRYLGNRWASVGVWVGGAVDYPQFLCRMCDVSLPSAQAALLQSHVVSIATQPQGLHSAL
jgi:hypothetical protein